MANYSPLSKLSFFGKCRFILGWFFLGTPFGFLTFIALTICAALYGLDSSLSSQRDEACGHICRSNGSVLEDASNYGCLCEDGQLFQELH